MIKLFFGQNDPPIRESFWRNNSLVTQILFELCPIWYINPVANFGTHPLDPLNPLEEKIPNGKFWQIWRLGKITVSCLRKSKDYLPKNENGLWKVLTFKNKCDLVTYQYKLFLDSNFEEIEYLTYKINIRFCVSNHLG